MDGKKVRPKIIASTATVRRAENQIQALFNRRTVDIFPPPGPDRRDSFFAETHTPEESNARLYLGVAAQGRSPKVVMLRAYLALLGAAQKAYAASGGKKNTDNPADPYMTLLGYFNSLRELGGSRRIVEDEVNTRLTGYAQPQARSAKPRALRRTGQIAYEVVELTSPGQHRQGRRGQAAAGPAVPREGPGGRGDRHQHDLGRPRHHPARPDGRARPARRPSAEYIQATSRVGRDPERPGLVVTLLNIHRPRDRSHYERFAVFHESFYRSVEATSVTPFSPRALDRGLAGTLVALARLGHWPDDPAARGRPRSSETSEASTSWSRRLADRGRMQHLTLDGDGGRGPPAGRPRPGEGPARRLGARSPTTTTQGDRASSTHRRGRGRQALLH